MTQEDQCAYIDAGCGGLVKPSLYSWDCLDTTSMTPIQASFVTSYLENCEKSFMGDDGDNGDDEPGAFGLTLSPSQIKVMILA